jgi:mono/diheme cytochrome c family protein
MKKPAGSRTLLTVALTAAIALIVAGISQSAFGSNTRVGALRSRALVATTKPKPKPKVKITGSPSAGHLVFDNNCETCHGATGTGGNGGPDLTTMPLAQSEAGVIKQVTNGGGGMPPFGGQLTKTQIENVAAFVTQDIVK